MNKSSNWNLGFGPCKTGWELLFSAKFKWNEHLLFFFFWIGRMRQKENLFPRGSPGWSCDVQSSPLDGCVDGCVVCKMFPWKAVWLVVQYCRISTRIWLVKTAWSGSWTISSCAFACPLLSQTCSSSGASVLQWDSFFWAVGHQHFNRVLLPSTEPSSPASFFCKWQELWMISA